MINFFKDFWLYFIGDEDAQRLATKANTPNKNTTTEQPELDCFDPDEFDMFNGDFDDEMFE